MHNGSFYPFDQSPFVLQHYQKAITLRATSVGLRSLAVFKVEKAIKLFTDLAVVTILQYLKFRVAPILFSISRGATIV